MQAQLVTVNSIEYDYDALIKQATKIDRNNFMDIVHDFILTGENMYGLKFDYLSVTEFDSLNVDIIGTSSTCIKCNTIKPIGLFYIKNANNRQYIYGNCKDCCIEYNKKNAEKIANYQKEYYRKKKKALTSYNETYRLQNKERKKENNRAYYEANKAKINEHRKNKQLNKASK